MNMTENLLSSFYLDCMYCTLTLVQKMYLNHLFVLEYEKRKMCCSKNLGQQFKLNPCVICMPLHVVQNPFQAICFDNLINK
jgi:hypothetical protein